MRLKVHTLDGAGESLFSVLPIVGRRQHENPYKLLLLTCATGLQQRYTQTCLLLRATCDL